MWYAVVALLISGTTYNSIAPHGWDSKLDCEKHLLTDENRQEVALLLKQAREAFEAEVKFVSNTCEKDPLHKDGTEI